MLVLSRKEGESIVIDGPAVVHVLDRRKGAVKLGIEAPREVNVRRGEVPRSESTEKAA